MTKQNEINQTILSGKSFVLGTFYAAAEAKRILAEVQKVAPGAWLTRRPSTGAIIIIPEEI